MAIDRQKSPYRRGIRFDQMPIPMVEENTIAVDAGAVQLIVESRLLTNHIIHETYGGAVNHGVAFDDGGATLHVCGTVDGLEHLRFDCFEDEPHYHYIDHRDHANTVVRIDHRDHANTVVRIDELAIGDPVEFTLNCVEHHLPGMLRHCGVEALADEVEGEPGKVSAAITEVRELMRRAAAG